MNPDQTDRLDALAATSIELMEALKAERDAAVRERDELREALAELRNRVEVAEATMRFLNRFAAARCNCGHAAEFHSDLGQCQYTEYPNRGCVCRMTAESVRRAALLASDKPDGLDVDIFAPPLPQLDCDCDPCNYLRRKWAEGRAALHREAGT